MRWDEIMNIGDAARYSGVSAKMIRHYEEIGLISAAGRTSAGYRTYGEADVHRLRFIKRARNLGFPIARIASLLSLWDNKRRSSSAVKAEALGHIADLKAQMSEMRAMANTLQRLADTCLGDERENCPILDDLAADDLASPIRKPCHNENQTVRASAEIQPAPQRGQKLLRMRQQA